MVRQVVFLFLMCCLLLVPAFADTTYGGTLSTTYITYAEDLYNGLHDRSGYTFARTGDYEYTLFVGDVVQSGGKIDGSDGGTVYRITQVRDNYTTSYISLTSEAVSDYTLVFGDELIYCSLPGFPCFDDDVEEVSIAYVSAFILACIFILDVLRSVFFRAR